MEEPVIINSQLSFDDYQTIVKFTSQKARGVFFILMVGLLLLLVYLTVAKNNEPNETMAWIAFFYIMSNIVFYSAFTRNRLKKTYDKIKAIGEPKVYEFNELLIAVTAQTLSTTNHWTNVKKVIERPSYFLMFSSGGHWFYYLPVTGFTSDAEIERFRSLIKSKGIKYNIK